MKKIRVIGFDEGWWEKTRAPSKRGIAVVEDNFRPFKDAELYTTQEVGKKLKRSAYTVYRWIHDGKLDAQPVSKGWLIQGVKINDFLFHEKCRRMARIGRARNAAAVSG